MEKKSSAARFPSAKLLTAGALSLLFAFSPSAWSADNSEKPVQGGILNVGLGSDTPTIDPHTTAYSVAAVVTRNVLDSLVGQAEDNSFTPWLAERWEISDDRKVYTFHLRKDVTFSDGTKLDAAAVKYNFDRILDPKTISPYSKSLLGPVEAVETPDDYTVVLRYKEAFAPLLQGLSLPYLGIQSPTYLKNTPNTSNTVVGSGPFILDSFVKGSGSKLSKRADYNWGPGYATHQGPAYLDGIEFKFLPEAAVRLGALNSGQVHAIDAIPPVNHAQVLKNGKLQVVSYENPGVNRVLYLNIAQGPFQDVKVRQAFQSSVDGPAAVKATFFGTLKAADNVLGPSTLYYDPAIASTWGFDTNKANRLLDEAGWSTKDAQGYRTKDGKRLTARFIYVANNVESADVALFQAVQFQVKQTGFDLKLDPVDSGIFSSRTASGDYDIASNFFVRPEPDILRTVFHSAYIPPQGNNHARVNTLDDKLIRAVGAGDEERKRLYHEVQREVIEQAYVVPLYVPAYQLGLSKKVHGVNWATNAKPNFYDAWISR
ncbi:MULTISPECIES: ABC transporter substrate-binding protein [Brenneria]|uniref:ABC transporter substrate-binding protein n=1 Tax=Brenneria nigrifluens DSM 30175 = ATCC 13028 TaxID=1121120 RepID=A0A2U1UPJ1_9GAMM|nr:MULTISPECIES: ABC transporter substrate-binding protein [Brenneria]EHD23307.1 ABC-type transporter, periplasmic subunit [Brenneria sp. EniD312]PWC23492.1 ABC transporter substrate-binding protein [Brenneria nigrifluens DSM 30175 = ATCC 13028]QCR06239.1 ABC transporter substrate-binding protein [Brenneria nigrifluens DSM 30175 = ATCC 13028]